MEVVSQLKGVIGQTALEDWKDQLAQYWGVTLERAGSKKLIRVFRSWGMTEDEAIALEVKGRDDRSIIVEHHLGWLLHRVARKFEGYVKRGSVTILSAKLELAFKPDSECIVIYEGKRTKKRVAGHVGLVGTVKFSAPNLSPSTMRIFHRFIGKTFFQYVGRSSTDD